MNMFSIKFRDNQIEEIKETMKDYPKNGGHRCFRFNNQINQIQLKDLDQFNIQFNGINECFVSWNITDWVEILQD